VLAALTKYLVHLEKAVIGLLFFIGAKMTLQSGTMQSATPASISARA
jgi:predicted tellurium resistance membrane protein TerC